MKIELKNGNYYHIFNHAVGKENLFRKNENFTHFLRLYDIFISSIADTFAWCLMPNHFHFLVRIKEDQEIGFLDSLEKDSPDIYVKWKTYFPDNLRTNRKLLLIRKPIAEKQFSHLFDAYAKAYNNSFKRKGQLFLKSFEMRHVTNQKYFKNLIFYIHNNPVHHGFVEHITEYPWTSYYSIISVKPTKLQKEKVLDWFESDRNFKTYHNTKHDDNDIVDLIIE